MRKTGKMGKKRRNKYPEIERLEIIDIAAEGKSMGLHEGVVVFVPNTIPGDVVRIQINNRRRRFMEGYVLEYYEKSSLRCDPICQHFGECGGCRWQSLPYKNQLEYKERQVKDQLQRLGGIKLPEIEPIVASAETEFYRNKLEFTFSNRRWVTRTEVDAGGEIDWDKGALGFHVPGMFDKVLDIKRCYLQREPSNAIRLAVAQYALDNKLSFYDIREHNGLLRNLIIRTSTTGDVMVIVVFAKESLAERIELLTMLEKKFPEISSLNYIINEKLNDSITDQIVINYSGLACIEEEMEGLRFRINPKSFYQTNSHQAYELYKITREFAQLKGDEIVYDLYTGIGTIANFIARSARHVIGIEYVEEAIIDAKNNSQLNGIENCCFFAGDMKNVLTAQFIAQNGKPDVIILDPPRAGIDPSVARVIIEAAPERIVYVSCNPATQARDLAIFDGLYSVERVRPVDMFPHTHHVENVVQLKRRPSQLSKTEAQPSITERVD